jgi:putative membrane protein
MSINLQPGEELVAEASFDPAWKTYSIVNSIIGIGMLCAVIGTPASFAMWDKPGEFVGAALCSLFGAFVIFVLTVLWIGAYFRTLECYLTSRALVYRRGVFVKTEKTIPLTRIQDLGMIQGPLMRAFGIHKLKIETAGQSTPGGAGEAALVGVVDALEFRDHVLSLRNSLETDLPGTRDGLGQTRPATISTSTSAADLSDIHNTLKRIENHLERMADNQTRPGS